MGRWTRRPSRVAQGEIRVEAKNNVSIAGDIFARGDFVFPGFGTGGKIGPTTPTVPPLPGPAPIRAFLGTLSWTSGTGDARPTGAGVVNPAQRGEINLQACGAVSTVGATFPTNGAAIPQYPNVLASACVPAGPTAPTYATPFPSGACQTQCGQQPAGIKSGVKFNDLNGNGTQDAGEPGLIGWKIHVFNTATLALVQSVVTVAADPAATPATPDGFYSFTLDPGSYTVCEEQQTGWQQTAPLPGSVPPPIGETLADCAPFAAASGLTLGPRGYNFTIVTTEIFQNNNFGNFQPPGACLKFPTLVPTSTFTLNADPTQIQKIIDAAAIDDVILLLPQNAVKTESITINKRIQLIGCSITLSSATVGAPVVTITSGANGGLTKDVHATGSTVAGYKIEGSNHTIVNVRAFKNAIGFWITGNSNVVTGALGTLGNGTGVRIDGNDNVLDTNNGVQDSTGDGVVIGASATGNTVKKYTVTGSGGNGFKVETGASLTVLSENKAHSNGLNGYLILGGDTTMSKNVAGDTGTGNKGDGIRVDGSNGPMSENVSKANTLVGIRVTGTGHKLTKNKSGGTGNQNNGSCQYVVGASNVNGGSNTSSNNATFTFTNAGANSPTGCVPAP